MRSLRFAWLFCLLTLPLPIQAQQTVAQPGPPLPAAPRDAQALSIVNQALTVAGGTVAISAIQDYVASGTVTFHSNPDVQGPVTLNGLGLDHLRQDASLPAGVRSLAISNGQTTTKENGRVRQLYVQTSLMTSGVVVPAWQLAAALNGPQFSVLYKGIVQVDGQSAHDIRVQLVLPQMYDPDGIMAEFFAADFFVDTTTFQILMTQDEVPSHFNRQVRYSDYRLVSGVLVPFSIDQQIAEQRIQTVQLQQISFNTGLQDSAFVL